MGIKAVINQKFKEALKKNWGEKADALDCYAEVKLIDPLSSWCCYIFAMDQNEEMVHCIMYSNAIGVEVDTQCVYDIYSRYNEEGNNPIIDTEYRRMNVKQILKRLKHDT
jgi:hypothetical protein